MHSTEYPKQVIVSDDLFLVKPSERDAWLLYENLPENVQDAPHGPLAVYPAGHDEAGVIRATARLQTVIEKARESGYQAGQTAERTRFEYPFRVILETLSQEVSA